MCQASARTVVPCFETSRVVCEVEKMSKVNTNKIAHAVKRDAKFISCFSMGVGFLDIEFEGAGLHSIFV